MFSGVLTYDLSLELVLLRHVDIIFVIFKLRESKVPWKAYGCEGFQRLCSCRREQPLGGEADSLL